LAGDDASFFFVTVAPAPVWVSLGLKKVMASSDGAENLVKPSAEQVVQLIRRHPDYDRLAKVHKQEVNALVPEHMHVNQLWVSMFAGNHAVRERAVRSSEWPTYLFDETHSWRGYKKSWQDFEDAVDRCSRVVDALESTAGNKEEEKELYASFWR
jgi:hypothetical protein